MPRVLLIEDDPDIIEIVSAYFKQSNFDMDIAKDGLIGLQKALEIAPDLILLDWTLPGLDGLELLKRLRVKHSIPVIMITARTEEIDRIMGLEFGADDYLTKPFSVRELVARVRAVLRRTDKVPNSKAMSHKGLSLDTVSREVHYQEILLDLTTLEFDLLCTFMTQISRVFTRNDLLLAVWSDNFIGVDRVVDVHVSNLRKKLELVGAGELLHTVRGVGYKFS